jgi:hypothetical protein
MPFFRRVKEQVLVELVVASIKFVVLCLAVLAVWSTIKLIVND